MLGSAQRTIDLAVRVWLGIAAPSDVVDWVDARLAKMERADALALRLAEHRAPHEVAEDLLDASGIRDPSELTRRMIVALGAAFERGDVDVTAASRFTLGPLLPRIEAAGLAPDAYGIDDGLALARDGIVTLATVEADFRALVADCAAALR